MTYKKRYTDTQKQFAYMNACDCLRYGYGRKFWNCCGIDEKTATSVWKTAVKDLSIHI